MYIQWKPLTKESLHFFLKLPTYFGELQNGHACVPKPVEITELTY